MAKLAEPAHAGDRVSLEAQPYRPLARAHSSKTVMWRGNLHGRESLGNSPKPVKGSP